MLFLRNHLAALVLLVFVAAISPTFSAAQSTGKSEPPRDPDFQKYGIYNNTAPRAAETTPLATKWPLQLQKGDRITLVGNTLLERSQLFGHVEALLHQRYPKHQLVVRH